MTPPDLGTSLRRMLGHVGQLRLDAIRRHGRTLLRKNRLYSASPEYDWWLVVTDDHGTPQPLARRTGSGRRVPFVCGHGTAVKAMDILSDLDGRNWWVMRACEWLADTTPACR